MKFQKWGKYYPSSSNNVTSVCQFRVKVQNANIIVMKVQKYLCKFFCSKTIKEISKVGPLQNATFEISLIVLLQNATFVYSGLF